MAISFYTSSGQPLDSVGVDGDLCWDTLQRITWGPKGKTTSGSWAGTAYSNIGPTGPAVLAGIGAPSSGYGQIGNAYLDAASGNVYLKSSSGWAQTTQLSQSFSPILQGAGPPNSSTAPIVQTGQMYFDQQNSLLYGPSTSASAAGLTQVTNVVGPTGAAGAAGATGSSTAYRQRLQGYFWAASAPTAGTAYPVCMAILGQIGSGSFALPITEPMWASGSLTAISAYSVAGTGASAFSFSLLKNGTVVYTTGSNFITIGTAAATAYRVLPTTGLTFSAGDLITMTATPASANSNLSVGFSLFYTTNS